jgi:hypothetical protein
MDHEIDKQEPSGKEGGQVKVGDKVWVRAIVEGFVIGGVRIQGLCGGGFWTVVSDLRPEAEMLDRTELIAKHNKEIEVQGERAQSR